MGIINEIKLDRLLTNYAKLFHHHLNHYDYDNHIGEWIFKDDKYNEVFRVKDKNILYSIRISTFCSEFGIIKSEEVTAQIIKFICSRFKLNTNQFVIIV